MDLSTPVYQQVRGDHNIVTGTGDIQINYHLPASESADRRDLLVLLRKVRTFWIEGVLQKSLSDAVCIDLAKQTEGDAVEHPWGRVLELPDKESLTLPPETRIHTLFVERNYSLLILGQPGSGKTITLLELARDLINQAEHDPTAPVPVVFNLSTWGVRRAPLKEWLVDELQTKYQVSGQLGRRWLARNRLLLLLDGLDELTSENQAPCVQAINAYMEENGVSGIAVCSRTQEYRALPVRLRLNAAISLLPLRTDQVLDHLDRVGPELSGLKTVLAADASLSELAQSPLLLKIMTQAYRDEGADSLVTNPNATPASRRADVFEAFLERMFARRDVTKVLSRDRIEQLLTWLARQMTRHSQTIFLLEQLQPSWLMTSSQRWLYVLGSRMGATALIGLSVVFCIQGFSDGWKLLVDEPAWPFGLMSIAGIAVVVLDQRTLRQNSSASVWNRRSVWKRLGITIGLFGVLAILTGVVVDEISRGGLFEVRHSQDVLLLFMLGCAAGAVCWLVFGLRSGHRSFTSDIRPVEAIRWGWSGAGRASLWGIAWGAFVWLIALIFGNYIGEIISGALGFLGGGSKGYWQSLVDSMADLETWLALLGFAAVGSLMGAALGGLAGSVEVRRAVANQGIRTSIRNGVVVGLLLAVGFTTLGALLALIIGVFDKSVRERLGSILWDLTTHVPFAAIPALLWFGWMDAWQHYCVRFLLIRQPEVPLRMGGMLDAATHIGLLRKVGGGYIFIHRLLLDHFVDRIARQTASPSNPS